MRDPEGPGGVPVDPVDPANQAELVVPVVPVAEEKPMRTWLWPTLLIFGLVVGAAFVVMILVSTADFDSEPTRVTPSTGPCQPFCPSTVAPPAP